MIVLCYWYHLRGRCEYGDRCLYVHDFVYDATEEYCTGSGRDSTMIKEIDLDDVRMLDPDERRFVLIERENARLEMKRIEEEERLRREELARIERERWELERLENEKRRQRFRNERAQWDFVHPTKIMTIEAEINEEDFVLRCRVPLNLEHADRYAEYFGMRFIERTEWGDDFDQRVWYMHETIHIRDGDTTDVGFVKFDPECVLILHQKLPADLMHVVYTFLTPTRERRSSDYTDDSY